VISLRRAVASPLGALTVISAALALVSPWSVYIPVVQRDVSFGFQNPICWLVVLALFVALFTSNPSIRLAAVLVDEIVLLGWFGWAMWAATTSLYAALDFPFIGIDLIGPGWFYAALGLFAIGTITARQYDDQRARPGRELAVLSLIPGMGLVRLGRTTRGVLWAVLVSSAVFIASADSPIAPLFTPASGHYEMPSAPPTRALEWILLGIALILYAASMVDTFLRRIKR
jgi:hypothetical protein